MKKSEKRRIGEARQAQFAKESRESGLKAQKQAHELAAERKAKKDKIEAAKKAKAAMESMGNSTKQAGRAGQSLGKTLQQMSEMDQLAMGSDFDDEEYPSVLDMTDETAYSA